MHLPSDPEARPAGAELAWLVAALLAISASLVFEHWVVHLGMIVPLQRAGVPVPAWVHGVLYAPEMVACFATGWRLRGWRWVALYAVGATLLRQAFQLALSWLGQPGHAGPLHAPVDFLFTTPLVGLAYLVIFGLASESAREIEPIYRS